MPARTQVQLLLSILLGWGRGRAADCSTALLQTRASAINAHGSSDHGFAGSFIAVDDLGRDQRVIY